MFQQPFHMLEPGNARHMFAREQSPKHHHQPAICDSEIGREQSRPIIRVVTEGDHGGCGGRNQQPAAMRDFFHRLARVTAEKLDPENLVRLQRQESERLAEAVIAEFVETALCLR